MANELYHQLLCHLKASWAQAEQITREICNENEVRIMGTGSDAGFGFRFGLEAAQLGPDTLESNRQAQASTPMLLDDGSDGSQVRLGEQTPELGDA